MPKRILILVSNPEGTTALNLPRELRKLQEAVQRSQHRDYFEVKLQFAATETELRRHILDGRPQIVHFCGHGTTQGLVLEDEQGKAKVASNEFLTSLLKDFADRIECVLLNACDTEPLTDALAAHLNYVIGMGQSVRDKAAIAFAEAFYDALGAGEVYEKAFEMGRTAVLGLASSRRAESRKMIVVDQGGNPVQAQNQEHWIPVLKVNPNPKFSARKLEMISSPLYTPLPYCERWALIVGISHYKYKRLNLKYADRDADALYDVLTTPSGGGFKQENICKLTNENATTGSITQALRSFLKKPAREDLVVIYFACHGAPDFDRPGNVYLLSHDSDPNDIAGTALPMREIDLSLKDNLHAEKVVVLVDACHSAAIGGGIGRRSAIDDSTLLNRYLQHMSEAKGGLALLTSAEANEVSFEDARWGGGHGVFTHYLLDGMRGAADTDRNGIITIGELFEYVRDNVKRATNYKQHPLIGSNAFDRNLPIAFVSRNSQFSECLVDIAEQYPVQEAIRKRSAPQKSRLRELFTAGAQTFEFQVRSINKFGQSVDEHQRVAECFVEDLGNGILLEMVFVPEGTFLMGTSDTKSKRLAAERPQHQVTVKPLLISKHPITIAQWTKIASLPQIHQNLKRRPSRQGAANQPVVNISWHNAIEFCNRLSQKAGKVYRLPTEAEWEYSCRAGTQTPFHFGETLTSDIANYDATYLYRLEARGINRGKTTLVGSFQLANNFGLFDMHGNVWEWCLDHWHSTYDNAPLSGEAWLDSNVDLGRVLRGGSWSNGPHPCRSTSRWFGPANKGAANIGFRVVLPL